MQFLQKWPLQSTQLMHRGTKTVALKCLISEPRLPLLVNSTFHYSSEAVRGFLVFSIVSHCGSLGSKETLGKSSIPKRNKISTFLVGSSRPKPWPSRWFYLSTSLPTTNIHTLRGFCVGSLVSGCVGCVIHLDIMEMGLLFPKCSMQPYRLHSRRLMSFF